MVSARWPATLPIAHGAALVAQPGRVLRDGLGAARLGQFAATHG